MTTAPTRASRDYGRTYPSGGWSYLAVPGRLLLSVIFLISGCLKVTHFSTYAGFMPPTMPAPKVMLGLAAFAELAGGLSLLLGLWSRIGALGLFVFLIPTTLMFHNFWAADAAHYQEQFANFLKNVAIMGGLLMVMAHGAGPLSVDAIGRRRRV